MSASLTSRRVGFAVGSHLSFFHHHPDQPALSLADRVRAGRIFVKPPLRLLGHLGFGDQPACRGIPPREANAGCFANQAAAAVAPDEILCPQRLAVGEHDVGAGVILRETRDVTSAIDRHRQLPDPLGKNALGVLLPQPEDVVVTGGKVADVQRIHVKAQHRVCLPLREKPLRDAALIEYFNGA